MQNSPFNDDDEVLDLVNEHDEVIGTILRADSGRIFDGNGTYIRFSECFIVNSNGEIWAPRRTANKKIAPNGLDFSAAGHVGSGKTYDEEMIKEISEELNLAVNTEDLKFIGTLTPNEQKPYFSRVYVYNSDQTPYYNSNDFVSAQWILPVDLHSLLRNGEAAKDDLLPALELLLANK